MSDYTPTNDPMWSVRHAWATSTPGDYVQNAADFDRRLAAHDESVRDAERERIAHNIETKTSREVTYTLGGNSAATEAQRSRAGVIEWFGGSVAQIAREG